MLRFILLTAALSGCATVPDRAPGTSSAWLGDNTAKTWQAERSDRGLVLVLPGSWGDTPADNGIIQGLLRSGVDARIELDDWTAGHWTLRPLLIPYNVRALGRNQGQGRRIAEKILAYQAQYPGRPVHLIGYSGGAAVAVLALEALPEHAKVTGAVLLAPSLACTYDLRPALRRTERGIKNFYSPLDIPVLAILCTAVGTSDGKHVVPAGAVGFFDAPASDSRAAGEPALEQQCYRPSMLARGHAGGHFGWVGKFFVADRVAPLVKSEAQPPNLGESEHSAVAVQATE